MQVLVAEDERITSDMIEGLLRDWGYDVVAAQNGREALNILLGDNAPKLAIIDWNMPELTGLEVCEQVRAVPTNTPPHIIMLTGRSSNEELVIGLSAGASDYIRKPFDPQVLRARISVGEKVVELQANVARRMQEFEDYVDDSPLGIIMVERDGTISFVNTRAYAIFGYDDGELIGEPIETLVWNSYRDHHVGMRDGFFKAPQSRMMSGRTSLFGQRKDGTLIPVAVGLNPIPRETADRVACTVLDLTESKVAEERLDQFYEMSSDIFCIARFDGHLVKVNSSLGRLLGYTYEDVMARGLFDFFHPEDVAQAQAEVKKMAGGHAVTNFQCRLRHKEGTDYWFEWNARAVSNAGVMYIAGRNVTDRVQAEAESGIPSRDKGDILIGLSKSSDNQMPMTGDSDASAS